jgi:hypothetical protein
MIPTLLPGVHPSVLSAVSFVSRTRGASQPVVILTTGFKFYVAKFRNFTGRCGLLAEAVGAGILSAMGLPVPEWNPVWFTDEFLDAHPEVWYRNESGREGIRPGSGLHFGSRLMVSANGDEPLQIIPSSWAPRIANRSDFVGALMADLWMNNCDRRQAIFLSDGARERLRAVFIDNDNAFGGYRGDEKTTPRRVMIPFAGFYDGVWTRENLVYWKNRLDQIDEDHLDAIFASVPEGWADADSIQSVRSQLRRRRLMLDSLIAQATIELGRGQFPVSSVPHRAIEAEYCSSLSKKPSRSVPARAATVRTGS